MTEDKFDEIKKIQRVNCKWLDIRISCKEATT